MVCQTRASRSNSFDEDGLRDTIVRLMREEMERIKEEFNTAAMTTLGGAMVRNQDGNPRQQMQFSRATKIEFPIFVREDVRGLLYKCEQFFSVDHIADDQKVSLKKKEKMVTVHKKKSESITLLHTWRGLKIVTQEFGPILVGFVCGPFIYQWD
ncbi:hypothetical protein Tco_0199773 [Tanacetum coccineum]